MEWEDLKPSDRKIIQHLLSVNYNKDKVNAFNIALDLGLSRSTVSERLRYLAKYGIVRKTQYGVYVLNEEYEKDFKEDLARRMIIKEEEIQKAIKFIGEQPDKAPVWAKRATEFSGIKTSPQEIIDRIRESKGLEPISKKQLKMEETQIDKLIEDD